MLLELNALVGGVGELLFKGGEGFLKLAHLFSDDTLLKEKSEEASTDSEKNEINTLG